MARHCKGGVCNVLLRCTSLAVVAAVGAGILTNVWTFWQLRAGIVPRANHRISKFFTEITANSMIPTLWRWCYSAAFSASTSKSPMKPLMTRIRPVLHPGCDGAYQWVLRKHQCYLRKISQNFLTTVPLRLPRMRSKRLLGISTIKSLHKHWKPAVWHCRKRRRKHG